MVAAVKRAGTGFWIIVLVVSTVVFVASLWNIDFAMWYKRFYLYYPWPGFWHRPAEPLGFWVNVQYYQLVLCFIIAVICAYKIGQGGKR